MAEVTCIIPVYNGEKYIAEAIKSVLGQTFPLAKIIVINDGSSDSTLSELEQFGNKIQVVDKEHAGVSAALNAGIPLVTTKYLAFIDADDLWLPTKIEKQVNMLVSEQIDLCFCNVTQFFSPEMTDEQRAKVNLDSSVLKATNKSGMLSRREVFEQVGLFNEEISTGDFIDWYTRAKDCGLTNSFVDEVLVHRRIHLSNFMRSEKADVRQYTSILREHLIRMKRKQNTI